MSLAWSSVKALSIPVGGTARDVKRISVGGVTLWEKPSPLPYDAEVEYIESTGTQYIDIGRAFLETDYMLVDATLTGGSNAVYLHGQNAAGGGRFAIGRGASTWNDWYFGLGDKNFRTGVAINSSRHVLELDGNADTAYIDDTAYTIGHTAWGQTDPAITGASLFCRTTVTSDVTGGFWIGRVYAVQIRTGGKNGALVRDYTPVRVGSGANAVGYLYDRANPTGGPNGNGLYGSATATPLGAGPDANA